MKQSLAMLLATVLLLFSLAGCGEKKDSHSAERHDRQRYDRQRQEERYYAR